MKSLFHGLACAALTLSLSVFSLASRAGHSVFTNPDAATQFLDNAVYQLGHPWYSEYTTTTALDIKDQQTTLDMNHVKARPAFYSALAFRLLITGDAKDSYSRSYLTAVRQYEANFRAASHAIVDLGVSDSGQPTPWQQSLFRTLNGLVRPEPQSPLKPGLLGDLQYQQSGLNGTAFWQAMATHQLAGSPPGSGNLDTASPEGLRLNALMRSLLDGKPRSQSFYNQHGLLKNDALLPEPLLSAFANVWVTALPGFALTPKSGDNAFFLRDGRLDFHKVMLSALSLSHWPGRGLSATDALLKRAKTLEQQAHGCALCPELKMVKTVIHPLAGDNSRQAHGEL